MKKNTPETDDGTVKRRGPRMGVIAALAVVAGAGFGAAGVYATGALSGNAEAGECAAAIAQGQTLKPLLKGDIAAMANRTQPNDLTAISFNGPDGAPMTLSDAGGGMRLVNLWATWCAPCREEMPALDKLQAEKGGNDFKVVAISVDGGSDEKPRKFFDEITLSNLDFYHDPTIGVFNNLKKQGLAFGLPVTLLIDEKNCVVANMNGPADWASPDAFALIDAATGG